MKKNQAKQPQPAKSTTLENAMEYFADRIATKRKDVGIVLPKRSMKLIKRLINNKRGYKISQDVPCALCGITYSTNWRYKLDNDYLYLCSQCKNKIKPSIYVKGIMYNDVCSKR